MTAAKTPWRCRMGWHNLKGSTVIFGFTRFYVLRYCTRCYASWKAN